MAQTPSIDLSYADLSDIRDAVPTLDLFAIRSLRRAGFKIVKQDRDEECQENARREQRAAWESPIRAILPR